MRPGSPAGGFFAIDPNRRMAQFALRPMDAGTKTNQPQFVIVGVSTGGDLTVGKATWGTNGLFGVPLPMRSEPDILTSVGTQCSSNGLNFADVTGMDWKAFLTPVSIPDRGRVEKKALVQVVVKATAGAGTGTNYGVVGISGQWDDDGDDVVDTDDTFSCFGFATSSVHVA